MLVIHVGPRKTGTTYLQSNFYRNREELLRHGWVYPVVAARHQSAHHEVASAKDDMLQGKGAMAKRLIEAAAKARANGQNLLLSAERFARWEAEDFVRFGKALGEDEVRIVYVLRDPMSLLISNWGEVVKNGKNITFADYVAKHTAKPEKARPINALLFLRPVLKQPTLKLTVFNFEQMRRDGDDFFTAFCRDILGVPGMQNLRKRAANTSLPVELSDYIRLLADRMDYDPDEDDVIFARRFQDCHPQELRDEIAAAIARLGADHRQLTVVDRDVEWYYALEAKTQRVLAPYLVPPVSGNLFSRGKSELATYDIDYLRQLPEIEAYLQKSISLLAKGKLAWRRRPIARFLRDIQRRLGL